MPREVKEKINYDCQYCDKSYQSKYIYNRHVRTHTGEKTFECTICPKKFNRKETLKNHLLVHSNAPLEHQCSICEHTFRRKSGLQRHVEALHTSEIQKKFQCRQCRAKFTTTYYLGRHMMDVHNGSDNVLKRRQQQRYEMRKHRCLECGKLFALQHQLLWHAVIHTDVDPYECERCETEFNGERNIVQHLKRHVGNKDYQCKECGKSFMMKYTLIGHMITHTGEKNFECHICGRKFNRNSTLKRHLKESKISCAEKESKLGTTTETPELEQNTTATSVLKCLICGDIPPIKSSLVDQFRPQNMGMRYICPECDVNLESKKDLHVYFRKASFIMQSW